MTRLQSATLDAVDAYIAKQTESISRPEAIRRILTEFLTRRGFMPKREIERQS